MEHDPPKRVPSGLALIESAVIRFIPQREHRYDTIGDWYFRDGVLNIVATEFEDPRWSWAIAFHELIEAVMCTLNGVTSEAVDDFDMGQGIDYDEPGRHPSAPYHKEHLLAFALERKLADAMGIDWKVYDASLTDKGVRNVNEAAHERAAGNGS